MNRLLTFAASAVVVGLTGTAGTVMAQGHEVVPVRELGLKPVAAARSGSLEGVVRDDRGAPVSGAAISAIGPANKVAIAGEDGSFRVGSLPPGPYVVRAHLVGYTPSRRQIAEVLPSSRTTVSVSMNRSDVARILAAGMVAERAADEEDEIPVIVSGSDSEAKKSELAWRMRHLQRSILKGRTDRFALGEGGTSIEGASDSPFFPGGFGALAKAAGSSARFASTLFGSLDLAGELNLLTTGSFNGVSEVNSDSLQRAVAYLSLQGTAGASGAWTVQGIMTQGDLGSWLLAGSYRVKGERAHVFDVGASFSSQRFLAGTGVLATPASEGTRSAGLVQFTDRWTLAPEVTVVYGARYARYSYLDGPGFFSPSLTVRLLPHEKTRILATVSQRRLAPGAEEFMPSLAAGLWVPPARTFEPFALEGTDPVQRTLHYEVVVERDLGSHHTLAFRGFGQQVDDQRAALFGIPGALPAVTSHYSIARAGDIQARGWSVGLSNEISSKTRGTLTYGYTSASWGSVPLDTVLAVLVPSVIRGPNENIHDLTTSLETELPAVATRLIVFYRVNSAFSRPIEDKTPLSGLDGRFDIQVTQPLHFLDFTAANWQVLVAFRNLFREDSGFDSIYDELLVVAPPKRVVGGVLVKF